MLPVRLVIVIHSITHVKLNILLWSMLKQFSFLHLGLHINSMKQFPHLVQLSQKLDHIMANVI